MARSTKGLTKVSLEFFCYEQDDQWIAYCPALDWSTYGDTLEEAVRMFPEALEILLEDLIERGTLERELIRLGWHLNPRKYAPPTTKGNLQGKVGLRKPMKQDVYIPTAGSDAHLAGIQQG